MRTAAHEGGHVIKDSKGNVISTREYVYTNKDSRKIVIQDHSAGHKKVDKARILMLDLVVILAPGKSLVRKSIIHLISKGVVECGVNFWEGTIF